MDLDGRVAVIERILRDLILVKACDQCGVLLTLSGDGCQIDSKNYCWACAPVGLGLDAAKERWGVP